MVRLLEKLFIKGTEENSELRRKYGVLCGGLGIFLNLVLCIAKLFAGAVSGSIAITADAVNNLSDAGSSIVTLAGFRLAGLKPDPEHPFGHGRIEYISGLIVSMIIVLMGFELGKSSVGKIISPQAVEFSVAALVILILSILVKLYMAFYNTRVGRRIDSAAMRATAADSLSDSLATGAALIGMLAAKLFGLKIDGWCGVFVALFILVAGVKAAIETIGPLLGQPPEQEFVDGVERIVMSYDDVLGIHDMVVHDYGPGRVMVSLHAEVDAAGDMLALHDTIDNAERELSDSLGCSAVIHMDPIVTDDEQTAYCRRAVRDIVASIDPTLTMHDFRMVPGQTHTNLIFDVVAPFGYKLSDNELKALIAEKVTALDKSYMTVITVDKSYIG